MGSDLFLFRNLPIELNQNIHITTYIKISAHNRPCCPYNTTCVMQQQKKNRRMKNPGQPHPCKLVSWQTGYSRAKEQSNPV